MARAIVDEVLPPAFISNRNNSHPGDEVVDKAVSLLSREHCTARLEKVWGPGDGRPVAELKEVINQLVEVRFLQDCRKSAQLVVAAITATDLISFLSH